MNQKGLKKQKESRFALSFFSPAKINLFFRLEAKRKDGFHNLSSLFQAISLGDRLTLQLADEDQFSSNVDYLSFNEQNLVIKALSIFRNYTKRKDPVAIQLNKEVPIETGLGGGSSNGSTLLWGLNQLLKTNLSLKELFLLAEKVSSDSPFFFSKGTALCEGKGEQVTNLKPLSKTCGWIIKPPFGISTPQAYSLSHLIKPSHSLQKQIESFYTPTPFFQNDLEESAFKIQPELKKIKNELLDQNHKNVFMTGSGSGLICLGKSPPRLKKTIQIYPFHYINRPLNQWYGEKESDS